LNNGLQVNLLLNIPVFIASLRHVLLQSVLNAVIGSWNHNWTGAISSNARLYHEVNQRRLYVYHQRL